MTVYPEVAGPDPASDPVLAGLLDALQRRHQGGICSVLLYGSCLRSGDLYDGLLDLYLICDSYRAAYDRWPMAAANWVLPPNVFYAEHRAGEKILRSKVTVISLRDFQRGCSPAWFESYIWGRFAQPTRVLYSRDETVRQAVEACLVQASGTLLRNAVPALPESGSLDTLWEQALGLSYGTELRTERSGRAAELVRSSRDFYVALTRYHADRVSLLLTEEGGELRYRTSIGPVRRRLARGAWLLRRILGKLLSLARLVKALFTFEGGLDYIAWKLSRHSGEEIVIPDRVRRAPLLFIWGFCWDLYRRGIFR